jgi:outer membrane receptor for ferrienterochelin and colicins
MKQTKIIVSISGAVFFMLMATVLQAQQEQDTIASQQLKEVIIRHRTKTTEIDMINPLKVEKISSRELLKSACCNLSESFETTPSVDVSYTDAISGYKQIQMLGLSGPYTLITRENIPDTRGLASITGLTFTPGTWIESMQLSKGTGSVVNGFESLAGQINIEWRKPFEDKEPRWHLNLYQSSQGRTEGNMVYRNQIKDNLSTNLFAHLRSNWYRNDQNKDGFLDQPLDKQGIIANRWFWFGPKGWEMQAGIKAVWLEQTGGQRNFHRGDELIPGKPWGYEQDIKRIDGWMKLAHTFASREATSIGLQLAAATHDQSSVYGLRRYKGMQHGLYANLIFQTYVHTTDHILKAGVSVQSDHYEEEFETIPYNRRETSTGVFAEYAWTPGDKFNVVAGIRGDYNNLFGGFVTPRIHMRWAPHDQTVFRISAGRAQRTANIFAENSGYMASQRSWKIHPSLVSGGAYGLTPEIAWNAGINFTQKFRLNYREGSVSAEYYYTHFERQVVADIEDPHEVRFYNIQGFSYAHSFQWQLDYELMRKWDIRFAYRWYDVHTKYRGIMLERPLVASHRAFVNTAYETKNKWKFDYTVQWLSSRRVPALHSHHTGDVRASYRSPSYWQMNAQITKTWKAFDLYVGVENITGYMQHDVVIGAENPYSTGFDASMIWGPVMGRNFYFGFRLEIP